MYGIDFGTSNTVVTYRPGAAGGTGHGKTRLLELGEGGVLPSLLYFERDRRPSVGAEAMADYGEALRRFRGSGDLYSRFRFFQGLKLALKDEHFEGSRVFGEKLSVEALCAIFLREVKRRADEALRAEGIRSDDELVLGRPVTLSGKPETDLRLEERFRKAAELAGFGKVDFVFEPVAASVSSLSKAVSHNVLVFDFGGGTLDISIARTDGESIEVLASEGEDLGGYLLNEDISRARIVRHFGAGGKFRTMTGRELEMPVWITDQVASFYALPLADIAKTRAAVKDLVYDALPADKDKLRGLNEFLDRNLAFSLFDRIDGAKIALSSEREASIGFEVPPYVRFREELSRAEFEAIVAPRVKAAEALVMRTLAKADMEAREVRRVVRVGGSCRVPAFARMLEGLFPGRVEEGEVFTSIAAGLIEASDRGLTSGITRKKSGNTSS
jgi:hypothetical chaperone protein